VADRVVIMNSGRIEQSGTPVEVFHHPASEFVMNFLGNVNIFHGRVEGKKAFLGPLEIECDDHHDKSKPARGLIRPHQLDIAMEINKQPGFRATVKHINAAGPQVKIELVAESGQPVRVDISHERLQQLGLQLEQIVYVIPREVNVFVD
jgi:sulfate transport system ATP-binding protein